MLGMMGIIVKNNQIQNTIQILQEIKPGEKFLCRFLNTPSFSRVCQVEEIQQWLLFQDQDEANNWVASSQQPPPEATAPTPPPAGGNGAVNKADAAEGSEPEGQDETTDEKPPAIVPAAPVPTPTTAPTPAKDTLPGEHPVKGDKK